VIANRHVDIAPRSRPAGNKVAADGAMKISDQLFIQPAGGEFLGDDARFEIADAFGEQRG
jgi:hypothetical protein